MKQQAVILCLFGKKGAGKDTFADLLIQLYTKEAYKIGFADTLKQVVGTAFGFDASQMDNFGYKENTFDGRGGSCRQRLTEVGELFRKQYGRDFWTQQLIQRIEAGLRQHPNRRLIIIKDARFLDELEALQSYGIYANVKIVSLKITRYYTVEDVVNLVTPEVLKYNQKMFTRHLEEVHSLRFQPQLNLYELIGVNDKAERSVDKVSTKYGIKNIGNTPQLLVEEAKRLLNQIEIE